MQNVAQIQGHGRNIKWSSENHHQLAKLLEMAYIVSYWHIREIK